MNLVVVAIVLKTFLGLCTIGLEVPDIYKTEFTAMSRMAPIMMGNVSFLVTHYEALPYVPKYYFIHGLYDNKLLGVIRWRPSVDSMVCWVVKDWKLIEATKEEFEMFLRRSRWEKI